MTPSAQSVVFTVGHSTHRQAVFFSLLEQHGLTAICDVRSTPYSRFNPQFDRETLERTLAARGIEYQFLGKELGARSEDPACYQGGKAQYRRIAQTELFQSGLKRVLRGMNDHRIALMCAEKEPVECHRTILVARHLTALGVAVEHIHADGRLESHQAALDRLARMLKAPENDLFRSREEVLDEVYEAQGERIAYTAEAEDAVSQAVGR